MGEPCLCGSPDCKFCYPGSWRQAKAEEAHETAHQAPDHTCPVCVMQRYQRMAKRSGVALPKDLWRTAWEAV